MSDEMLKSIENKLNSILKILALQYIENKPKEDQANILLGLGRIHQKWEKYLGSQIQQ